MTVREERQFRGISKRLAAEYLERLGGERTDDDRIEGDGWQATLSETTVDVAGSIRLNEVTVRFEGDEEALEPLIADFERKAMRAGG